MEEFVSIETEKLAREKGFNITQTLITNYLDKNLKIKEFTDSDGTLQSTLQKWLREIHKIHIEIEYSFKQNKYSIDVYNSDEKIIDNQLFKISSKIEDYLKYNNYEEALEIGLQEALKLIKITKK